MVDIIQYQIEDASSEEKKWSDKKHEFENYIQISALWRSVENTRSDL